MRFKPPPIYQQLAGTATVERYCTTEHDKHLKMAKARQEYSILQSNYTQCEKRRKGVIYKQKAKEVRHRIKKHRISGMFVIRSGCVGV